MRSRLLHPRFKPKQRRSELGLEAQQIRYQDLLRSAWLQHQGRVPESKDQQGRRRAGRPPELAAAMKHARKLGKGGKAR